MSDAAGQAASQSQHSSSHLSSLLLGVRNQDPDAWQRLADLFGPLVYTWCRQARLQSSDASDVAQEVLAAVAGHIEKFEGQHGRASFLAWLQRITSNKIADLIRNQQKQPMGEGGTGAQQRMQQSPATQDSSSSSSESSHGIYWHRAMTVLQAEFEEHTWQAFWRVTVDGQTPSDVAANLGISVNSVYQAKSRVLRRLRAEFAEDE